MIKRKGGLLGELMIYILVVMMIAAIGVMNPDIFRNDAENAAAQQTVASIAGAISQYKFEVGSYPNQLSDLTVKNSIYGPWMPASALPALDPWDNPYQYSYSSFGFAVWSLGKNKTNDSGGGVPSSFKGDDIGALGY